MILILITLIFPLSVLLCDFHTHCFQLVCGTTLAWLALALSPFSPFLPWFPTMPRSPLIPTSPGWPFIPLIPRGPLFPGGRFSPSVSSWTRHSLWSFITNLSFSTVPSLGSLRPGNAWHSRHTIGSWEAWETHHRSLKVKMICCLMERHKNWKLNVKYGDLN